MIGGDWSNNLYTSSKVFRENKKCSKWFYFRTTVSGKHCCRVRHRPVCVKLKNH